MRTRYISFNQVMILYLHSGAGDILAQQLISLVELCAAFHNMHYIYLIATITITPMFYLTVFFT